MEWTPANDYAFQVMVGDLREMFRANGRIKVKATAGKKRSPSQNDISHTWYAQVHNELREDTPLRVRCISKLHCGVPILRTEDETFRKAYDSLIRERFEYEEKIELMEWFPVTSLMNKEQFSQYLEAMQRLWKKRGVTLEFPEQKAA